MGEARKHFDERATGWLARRRGLLSLLMLGSVAMQLSTWNWYVEDAAISFSYAENLIAGEGLVAYPGGERVEGYSNPLWVAIFALGSLLGFESFALSRVLGCVFGALTLPIVWRIAGEFRLRGGKWLPPAACLALIGNAQFAIWNGSGLENSLFSLLLAAGVRRTLTEAHEDGPPWSALIFLGLVLTRPEGILYAAIGGGSALLFALQDRRSLRRIGQWLAIFFVPFAAYHLARYQYFAWPLPNTYYAKLSAQRAGLLEWTGEGWAYLRAFAGLGTHDVPIGPGLGLGYLLPVYVAGALAGVSRLPKAFWVVACAVAALLAFPLPAEFGWERGLDPARVVEWWGVDDAGPRWLAVRALGVLLGLGALSAYALLVGSRAAGLCCAMASAAAFFVVASRGDWMTGYRWLSLAAVPGSLLFAAGVVRLADALARQRATLRIGLVLALCLAYVVPQVRHLAWFSENEGLSPALVKRRVTFWEATRNTLHLEDFLLLDPDMGATLYWSDQPVVDLAGLVDVPIAHHHYSAGFLGDYVFVERRPEFAHVHHGWSKVSSLPRSQRWSEHYVNIPGYGRISDPHGGNFVRRDLLLRPIDIREQRDGLASDGELAVEAIELPALPSRAGGSLYLEVAMSRRGAHAQATDVRAPLPLFLRDEGGVVFEGAILPGYGWVHPAHWKMDEVFEGRYSLPLPDDLAAGRYDLGVGLPPNPYSDEAVTWFPDVVEIASHAEFERRWKEDWGAMLAALESGACEAGEALWDRLRLRMHSQAGWREEHLAASRSARARCLGLAASRAGDRRQRTELLALAARLDHRDPRLRAQREALADELVQEGSALREVAHALHARGLGAQASRRELLEEVEAWQRAYWAFDDAARVDPTRAWARRWAEEARPHKLGTSVESAAWRLRSLPREVGEAPLPAADRAPVVAPDPRP